METKTILYIVKMFPRLSETFITNEILALEQKGLSIRIISLLKSDSKVTHEMAKSVRAQVYYLPESFWRELPRLVRAQAHFLVHFPNRWAEAFATMAHRHNLRATQLWLQAAGLAKTLEGTDVAHVHAHFSNAPTVLASMVAIFLGTRFSFTCHAKDVYARGRLHSPGFFRSLNSADFVVCVSEQTKKDIMTAWPRLKHERVHVIYNGLDLNRFQQGTGQLKDGLILAVGRLVEKKGLSYLIEACSLLKARSIAFKCEIVGDGELRKNLQNLIQSLDLENEVKLLGALPQQDLISHYRQATVFCLPAVIADNEDRDILPNVVKEAMAVGVPVVTTSIPAMDELVDNGRTGILVPPENIEALADRLEWLLKDQVLGQQLAESARKVISQKFDRSKNVAYLFGLFEKYFAAPTLMTRHKD